MAISPCQEYKFTLFTHHINYTHTLLHKLHFPRREQNCENKFTSCVPTISILQLPSCRGYFPLDLVQACLLILLYILAWKSHTFYECFHPSAYSENTFWIYFSRWQVHSGYIYKEQPPTARTCSLMLGKNVLMWLKTNQ